MNPNNFVTTLNDLIQNNLADVHTMLPGKITSVNYGSGQASVLPLVKTQIGVNKSIAYPEMSNVPLVIMSGNGGKARITFPISAGDTVIVLFSERDPTNMLASTGTDAVAPVQTAYLGLYPIGILACISTNSGAKSISNEDVVLENDKGSIGLKPDGTMTLKNSAFSGVIMPDGNFIVNGLTITPSGNIITKSGVDLDAFYQKYISHLHSGVQSGGSNSGPPVL